MRQMELIISANTCRDHADRAAIADSAQGQTLQHPAEAFEAEAPRNRPQPAGRPMQRAASSLQGEEMKADDMCSGQHRAFCHGHF